MAEFSVGRARVMKVAEINLDNFLATQLLPALDPGFTPAPPRFSATAPDRPPLQAGTRPEPRVALQTPQRVKDGGDLSAGQFGIDGQAEDLLRRGLGDGAA